MGLNQTAREIAAEYEAMAIKSANEHWFLKKVHPSAEFPALANHVSFCTMMQKDWEAVAYKIESVQKIHESDGENHSSEWGLM